MSNLLHCADLGNPVKPLDIYEEWVDRIMEDNFRQGDKERDMGISISPLMDRYNVTIPKAQVMEGVTLIFLYLHDSFD